MTKIVNVLVKLMIYFLVMMSVQIVLQVTNCHVSAVKDAPGT